MFLYYIIMLSYNYRVSFQRTKKSSGIIDEETQLELDVKCLQILRALIYNKSILISLEDKERQPEKYRRYVSISYIIVTIILQKGVARNHSQ